MKEIKTSKIMNYREKIKYVGENFSKYSNIEYFYRFWEKVDIRDCTEECWNWTASTFSSGYGQFWDGCNNVYAHRMAYILTKGPISDELYVLHTCNNPRCCSPNHLELGDQFNNMQYMVKCNRQIKGENHGMSVLTENQVRAIHRLYSEQRKLHPLYKQWQITGPIAKRFGIAKSTIDKILSGLLWRHIHEDIYKCKEKIE